MRDGPKFAPGDRVAQRTSSDLDPWRGTVLEIIDHGPNPLAGSRWSYRVRLPNGREQVVSEWGRENLISWEEWKQIWHVWREF